MNNNNHLKNEGFLFEAIAVLRQVGNYQLWFVLMWLIVIASAIFALSVLILYINQPLADVYAFRQTQTALTSFWMMKEGWELAYQTPVLGYPWSVPFEFPLYQAIVALISSAAGLDLSATGRFVSFVFLVLCVWPAIAITRRLNLPNSVLLVFCALMFTSPYLVYWSRTFMIESTAFFFSFASIPFAIDIIRRKAGWKSIIVYLVFASVGVLQKSTTGGPVQLFILVVTVICIARQYGVGAQAIRHSIRPVLIIILPVIVGLAWTQYTDIVKSANPFAVQLTSGAMSKWNFGTISQKFSLETWSLLLWERSLAPNAGGYVGLIILLLPWYVARTCRKYVLLTLAALTMYLLPMIIFTNVHYIHEYYQVASIPYLIAALSIIIGGCVYKLSGMYVFVPIAAATIIILNIASFNSTYGIVAARSLQELDPRSVKSYKIGRYLRKHTNPEQGLVMFGQSYSSEVTYQAQRKSLTADTWFSEYKDAWKDPKKYLGDLELGAIVVCPSSTGFPGEQEIKEKISSSSDWNLVEIEGCPILLANN